MKKSDIDISTKISSIYRQLINLEKKYIIHIIFCFEKYIVYVLLRLNASGYSATLGVWLPMNVPS